MIFQNRWMNWSLKGIGPLIDPKQPKRRPRRLFNDAPLSNDSFREEIPISHTREKQSFPCWVVGWQSQNHRRRRPEPNKDM